MQDYSYIFCVFLAMMAVSFAERALPFIAGDWLKKQKWVASLGDFLPLAIMVLLVVSSATSAALGHDGYPIPEISAILTTVLLQWFFKNSLISIFAGTAVYVAILNGWLW